LKPFWQKTVKCDGSVNKPKPKRNDYRDEVIDMDNLEQVGVELVVKNAEQAAEEWERQEKLVQKYNDALLKLAQTEAKQAALAGDLAKAQQILYDALTDSFASVEAQNRALAQLEALERAEQRAADSALRVAQVNARRAAAAGDLAKAQQILYDALTDSIASEEAQAKALAQLEELERAEDKANQQRLESLKKVTVEYNNLAEKMRILPQFQDLYIAKIKEMMEAENQLLAQQKAEQLLQQDEMQKRYKATMSPYLSDALSPEEIQVLGQQIQQAKELGVAYSEVSNALQEMGLNFDQAAEAMRRFWKDKSISEILSPEELNALQAQIEGAKKLGVTWGETFQTLKNLGLTAEQASEAMSRFWNAEEHVAQASAKVKQGVESVVKQMYDQGVTIEEMATITRRSVEEIEQELRNLGVTIKKTGEETKGSVEAQGELSESAIRASRAFFALTLASFGLMSISTLDPKLQQVNRSLENMSRRDDVADTLSKITGASKDLVETWMKAAGKDPSFAQELEKQVKAIEPMPPLIAAVSAAWKEVGGEMAKLPDLSGAAFNVLKFLTAGIVGYISMVSDFFSSVSKNLDTFVKDISRVATVVSDITGIISKGISRDVTDLSGIISDVTNKITKDYSDAILQLGRDFDPTKIGQVAEDIAGSYNKASQKALDLFFKSMDEAFQGRKLSEEEIKKLTEDANQALEEQGKTSNETVNAILSYANALNRAADANENLQRKVADEYAKAQQQYQNTVADAVRARQDAIYNAEQNLTDRIADLWRDLQNNILKINQSLADKIFDINTRLSDRIADIQTQLQNRISDIQQGLSDRIANIQQDLANRLAELDHERVTAIRENNQKIEEAQRELAYRLYEIERERIESTKELDFNTAEQLRKAKTENEREEILRRHQFEQAQIDQRANDAQKDAIHNYQEKLRQFEQEKKAAEDNYNYQVALAKKLAEQKEAEARHSAEVAIAQAKREAEQQIATAQREAAEQLLIAQREHDEALAEAQRRYEQEKESAIRSYNEQVAAAKRAEAEKIADAKRALEQRNAEIAKSYQEERKQIFNTLQEALDSYQKQVQGVMTLAQAMEVLAKAQERVIGLYKEMSQFPVLPIPMPAPSSGQETPTLPPGGYGGLELDVPPGHPYDTYLVRARTGEHVSITPPGYATSSSAKTINFYIYDATDPQRVANIIDAHLDSVGWR